MDQFKVVLQDGHFFEGPRWRDGRLFASDFFGHQVVSTDLSDDVRVEARVDNQPSGLGWTPDGRLLIVSMLDKKLLRREASGELVEVASLGEHSYGQQTNDMLVDSQGRAYISSIGFDPHVGENIQPAPLIRVDPDGSVHEAAPREMFMPNGIALLPGNVLVVAETLGNRLTAFDVQADGSLANQRAWAEFGPRLDTDDLMAGMGQVVVGSDGIVADSEGAVWVADSLGNRVVRVAEGGQILQEISTGELGCYSCTLGGPEGRTLFLCVAPDFTPANRSAAAEAKVFAVEVDIPR
jgi:sugar lactone lactonase YvrE